MKFNIAHLFPEELDLYGENGNIKALKYALEKKGYTVTITNISFNDTPNFSLYDFIYIGSGRPIYLEKAKNILINYKEKILKYLEQDRIFLVTGNALSIFDFLNLYEYTTEKEIITSNVNATTSLCNGVIKAFQNTDYLIKTTSNLLFNIEFGYGNSSTKLEGFKYHNFYVTSLIGPLLARNNNLLNYFIELLEENKQA